jgi:hypothetical protein
MDSILDKFFFFPRDGYMMLSSIMFGDEDCARRRTNLISITGAPDCSEQSTIWYPGHSILATAIDKEIDSP